MSDNNKAQAMLENVRGSFNVLMSNMFNFGPEDMELYDKCYAAVFAPGVQFSYMSATFYAQFAAEILLGALSSNPFRRFLANALDDEAARTEPGVYWEPTMDVQRFGIAGKDYSTDLKDLLAMMNESYNKIESMNKWYGTPEGKNEFDMYCLSRRAVRDIKRMVMEFPYLVRRYDYDQQFAGEIMEYAGIVAQQIRQMASEDAAPSGT